MVSLVDEVYRLDNMPDDKAKAKQKSKKNTGSNALYVSRCKVEPRLTM